jgi:sirohydrochlorin cobaltochelatase
MSIETLKQLVQNGYRTIGELGFMQTSDGFRLFHRADECSLSKAKVLRSPEEARKIARYDRKGAYRPLKGAPNLPSGWVLELSSLEELKRALDYLYPGAVSMWRAFLENRAVAVSFRETLNRQTGMYRVAGKIGDARAKDLVANFCSSRDRCLRTILWEIEPDQTFLPASKSDPSFDQTGEGRKTIPYLCIEACNLLVAAARKAVVSERKADGG